MLNEKAGSEMRIAELEKALKETREKAIYYQWIATQSGIRSIREIDRISTSSPQSGGKDTRQHEENDKSIYEHELSHRKKNRIESLVVFAGCIMHDISNLLMTLTGNIDLLRMSIGKLPEKQQEFLDHAYRAGTQAVNFMKEIQIYIKNGISPKERIDVYDIVTDTFDHISGKIETGTIRLINDVSAGSHYVIANRVLLRQAFINITLNAIQAIGFRGNEIEGCIRIAAEKHIVDGNSREAPSPGRYIRISIEDNGIGMTEATLSHALEPLFSTKPVESRSHGLGLAMVDTIVTVDHLGLLNIESEYGKGTTIHIDLPRWENDTINVPVDADSPINVLVIDSDTAFVGKDTETLRRAGIRTVFADTCPAGLEIYRRRKGSFDCVFLATDMPDLSAEEAIHCLSCIDPDSPIILMSQSNTSYKGYPGIAGFINKPFSDEEFVSAVNKALSCRFGKEQDDLD